MLVYTRFHVFSPFSAHFYPPLHHNGKGSIRHKRTAHNERNGSSDDIDSVGVGPHNLKVLLYVNWLDLRRPAANIEQVQLLIHSLVCNWQGTYLTPFVATMCAIRRNTVRWGGVGGRHIPKPKMTSKLYMPVFLVLTKSNTKGVKSCFVKTVLRA